MKRAKTIGIVAPAGRLSPELMTAGVKIIEENGFICRLFIDGEDFGNFSASDVCRAKNLQNAYEDPIVDAILCARGGYGTGRIVEYLDMCVIRQNVKPFIGYSDITLLLNYFYKCGVLNLFHGPMLTDLVTKKDSTSLEYTLAAINNERLAISYLHSDDCALKHGTAKGKIIGGNLAVLSTILGTNQFSTSDNCIVFLEDVGEFMYRIDRYLNHLERAAFFAKVSGIIFGDISVKDQSLPNSLGFELRDLLSWYVKDDIPAVMGFPCGHGVSQVSIPFGEIAELEVSSNRTTLRF